MSPNTELSYLSHARYGKDKVRVLRVVRDQNAGVHHVVEYNVTVLVEGDIDVRQVQIYIYVGKRLIWNCIV